LNSPQKFFKTIDFTALYSLLQPFGKLRLPDEGLGTKITIPRELAQSGRASALGAEGRQFESGIPDHLSQTLFARNRGRR
jgi:hypothetical protein